ncbi:MAG TPA: MFS transporter [Gemmataceae bacterium]|nr:MFS transporter [Gemmataceae bacterium]
MGEPSGVPVSDRRLARWRTVTLAALFTGYAGYYICRSNLSVAAPLIVDEFPDIGKKELGLLSSAGLVAYALGKIVNGLLADLVGGRRIFLLGMFLSAACVVAFGLSSGLTAFLVIWVANRFVQSMGWGALVGIAGRWYPVRVYATVMGVLSLSYLIGDSLARLYLGQIMDLGVGWRGLFFASAGTLALIGLVGTVTIWDRPRDVGLTDPESPSSSEADKPIGIWTLLGPLLQNPTFWLACGMNFGLTLIRETFNYWTPLFLKEEADLPPAWAAAASAVFPGAGALAALAAGALSDWCRGGRGRIVFPSLLALTAALLALGMADVRGRPGTALILIGAVALTLMAPYTFCSGVIALDLGGRRGGATAAGLIDAAGYFGAVLSGSGIGALAETYGWLAAFFALASAAGLTSAVAAVYWLRQERAGRGASEADHGE